MARLSIVIPSRNRLQGLMMVLDSLRLQLRELQNVEILVIDDGSTDNTPEGVRQFCNAHGLSRILKCITIVTNESRGAARNVGISIATGERIAFLDADTVPGPNWLSSHGDPRRANVILLGPVFGKEGTPTSWLEQCPLPFTSCTFDYIRSIPALGDVRGTQWATGSPTLPWAHFWSGNVSLPRCYLLRLGGFMDLSGWASEDIELGFRLWELGIPFEYCAEADAFHIPHLRDRIAEASSDLQNVRKILQKHPTFPIECLVAFDCVNLNPCYDILVELKDRSAISPPAESEELVIEELAMATKDKLPTLVIGCRSQHVIGKLNAIKSISLWTECSYSLLGMHTPYSKDSFRSVVVLEDISNVPASVAQRIIQEALRIAPCVVVMNTPNRCLDNSIAERFKRHDNPFWYKYVNPRSIQPNLKWTVCQGSGRTVSMYER